MLRNTTYILYLVGGRIFDVFDSEIQGWSFQWLDTGHFHCEHLRHPTCAATAMAFCMVNWNFRILWYGGTVPYKGIFWGYIPLHRPYIGLIYSRYLQFRFLKWPLNWSWQSSDTFMSHLTQLVHTFMFHVCIQARQSQWWGQRYHDPKPLSGAMDICFPLQSCNIFFVSLG